MKKLEVFYNFSSHPGGYEGDQSSEQAGEDPVSSYRQGWNDCYWEIYDRMEGKE